MPKIINKSDDNVSILFLLTKHANIPILKLYTIPIAIIKLIQTIKC